MPPVDLSEWELVPDPTYKDTPKVDLSEWELVPIFENSGQALTQALGGEKPTLSSEAWAVSNDFLKGAARLGGFLYDIPKNSLYNLQAHNARMRGEPAEYKLDFSSGDKLVEALNNMPSLGIFDYEVPSLNEKPKTTTGKVLGAVAEQLPAVALPIGGAGARLSGAVMGGLGAGAVRASGGTPTQELIASLATPLAPAAVKAVTAPIKVGTQKLAQTLATTPARQEVAAANIIQNALPEGAINDIDLALAEGLRRAEMGDPLVRYKSPAELARSIPLASFEKDLGRALPEARIAAAENLYGAEGREAARLKLIQALTPEANQIMPETQRGEAIRSALQNRFVGRKDTAGKLYEQAEQGASDVLVDLVPMEQQARAEYARMFKPPFSGQPSSEVEGILSALGENTATQAEVNALSSRISGAIRNAPNIGSKDVQTERAFLNKIKTIVKAGEKEALKGTESGQQLLEARSQWKQIKDIYEKGAVGEVLGTKKNQDVKVVAEKVAKRIWDSPTATKRFIEASEKDSEVLGLLKGHAVSELTKNAQGQNWVKWIKSHNEQINSLFGKDSKAFRQVANDILSEKWVEKAAYAASRGQSATAQINSVREAKTRILSLLQSRTLPIVGGGAGAAIGGLSPVGLATGAMGAMAGQAIERIAQNAEQGINKILLEATMNPQTLKAMVSKPTSATLGQIYRTIAQQTADSEIAAIATGLAKGTEKENNQQTAALAQALGDQQMTESKKPAVSLLDAIKQVESAGNTKAVSNKGAKGAYQFMDEVGKEYHKRLGLTDKYDPFDETQQRRIADAFTSDLLSKYDDERVAIAGFNLGETKLDKLVSRYGSKWEDVEPYLPAETRNYVPKILNRLKG